MKKPFTLSIALFLLSSLYCADTVYSAVDPEKASVRIAGQLRAYSDQDWAGIAGAKSSEKYEIAHGDTLSDISERLFGEAKVWPKIWEINNTEILNPHMIEPKMSLVFFSGSGLSLPSLTLKSTGASTVKSHYTISREDRPGRVWDERTPMPAREWKNLPRQSWENVRIDLPADIDKDGFDSKNRVYIRKPATGLELPHIVACSRIEPIAEIIGTRSVTSFVDRGSEVTIRLSGSTPLEAGKTYSLLDPEPMQVSANGRNALSYDLLGKVKILGLQNGVYVGEIQNIKSPVARGAILVPLVPRIDKLRPVAGSKPVQGSLLADQRTGAFMTGQNKWVFIDRGTSDGVDRGMIFRIFQNKDPKTGKSLTPGNVFVQGDVQILQGCGTFSVGMFVWSRGEVPERYPATLLSDVTDEKIRFYFNDSATNLEPSDGVSETYVQPSAPGESAPGSISPEDDIANLPDPNTHPEILSPVDQIDPGKPPVAGEGEDWLDKLDNHRELRSEEENELQQLEKFQENQAKQEATPPSGSDPDSTEDISTPL